MDDCQGSYVFVIYRPIIMNEKTITSRDNALIKHARAVRDGKDARQIFIEGLRLCEEAKQALSVDDIRDVIYTERIAQDERGAKLLDALKISGKRTALVSESVFASLSDTKTPQGIVLLAARPRTEPGALIKNTGEAPLIVILHRINNPSNAGAILRTAEAAGASAAILTEGTSDIFSPKALRGAMGSSFRLPLWTGASFEGAIIWCQEQGLSTICADLRAKYLHTEIDWTQPSALVVGAESSGLTTAEMAQADQALRIPMRSPVESLNVAAAAAIVLYEAARQRAVGSKEQAR
jgi:RNA methyltransferase, TrmH family